ncbi:hypothetical protein MMC14_010126 [Varicellaria rhodocarpa]|nr:hypothetical protein [Varicellaria rhodocarpa]
MHYELRIHTHIHSRYQVFDASGQLPFSIVFDLCRRSPADTDPRSLLLEIAGSILDVPYALGHGLLTLYEQDPEDAKQWVEVDLRRLKEVAAKEAECLSLAFPVYQCYVNINGELASILEPRKKYMIRLASEDFSVTQWAYSDRKRLVDNDGKPNHDSEAVKLVNSKLTAGNATFKVVKNLSWLPRIETRMRLCASSPSSDSALANAKLSSSTALEVSVINTGSDSVTVQTRGHQRILIPWGPFQPEPDVDDDRMRIIDAMPINRRRPVWRLSILRHWKWSGGMNGAALPGAPVIRKIDMGALVGGLLDGQYTIRMQSRGCRWWLGEVGNGEIGKEEGEEGRVPAQLCGTIGSPLMLESQDEVELRIRDGKVD